VPRIAR